MLFHTKFTLFQLVITTVVVSATPLLMDTSEGATYTSQTGILARASPTTRGSWVVIIQPKSSASIDSTMKPTQAANFSVPNTLALRYVRNGIRAASLDSKVNQTQSAASIPPTLPTITGIESGLPRPAPSGTTTDNSIPNGTTTSLNPPTTTSVPGGVSASLPGNATATPTQSGVSRSPSLPTITGTQTAVSVLPPSNSSAADPTLSGTATTLSATTVTVTVTQTESQGEAPTPTGSSGSILLSNGQQAQKLNAQFATLTPESPCQAPNEIACVNGQFAQCPFGTFVLTPCGPTLQCVALPLTDKTGTTITCDTLADAQARIADTGATGGLTGSG